VSGLGKKPRWHRQIATPSTLTEHSVLGPHGYGKQGSSAIHTPHPAQICKFYFVSVGKFINKLESVGIYVNDFLLVKKKKSFLENKLLIRV